MTQCADGVFLGILRHGVQEIESVKYIINIIHINVDNYMYNMRRDHTGFLLEPTVSSRCGT